MQDRRVTIIIETTFRNPNPEHIYNPTNKQLAAEIREAIKEKQHSLYCHEDYGFLHPESFPNGITVHVKVRQTCSRFWHTVLLRPLMSLLH